VQGILYLNYVLNIWMNSHALLEKCEVDWNAPRGALAIHWLDVEDLRQCKLLLRFGIIVLCQGLVSARFQSTHLYRVLALFVKNFATVNSVSGGGGASELTLNLDR
jgi:hypothetical protein